MHALWMHFGCQRACSTHRCVPRQSRASLLPACLQAEALKSKMRGEAAPEAAPATPSDNSIFRFGRGAETGALLAAGTAIAAALAVRSG